MNHDKIEDNTLHLFKDSAFVCLGFVDNTLIMSKVDEHSVYDPKIGWLLFDVNIYKNTDSDTISITGSKFRVTVPEKNIPFVSSYSIINQKDLFKYKNVSPHDYIKLPFGKIIIKRRYYYENTLDKINRCFMNVPIMFVNCSTNKDMPEDTCGINDIPLSSKGTL